MIRTSGADISDLLNLIGKWFPHLRSSGGDLVSSPITAQEFKNLKNMHKLTIYQKQSLSQ